MSQIAAPHPAGLEPATTTPLLRGLLARAITPPKAPDLEGDHLGHYRVGRMLGEGGMGMVYEAVDEKPTSPWFGQKVALKVLSGDLDAYGRLVQEAQHAAALDHPHIVRVYEIAEPDDAPYLTMAYIDGASPRIPEGSPRRAAEIVFQVTEAVDFAHRHGILHRDLKPANVLIDRSGKAFVTDFGLATRVGMSPLLAGTPPYMAPEALAGKAPTTAADIWGLGAILYELIAGRPPFDGDLEKIKQRVGSEPPPPLPSVDPDLAAVCFHCLEKDPTHRYATAGELAADLRSFLTGRPVSVRRRNRKERALRFCQRHPWIAALGALLCIATLYGGMATLYAGVAALSRNRAERAALHAADFAAHRAADLTALQFDRYKARVEAAGRDPRVLQAALNPESTLPSEICAALGAEPETPTAASFSHWFMFDADGKMIGRSTPAKSMGKVYTFRDYYQGAAELEKQGRRTAYVSRTYRSEGDDIFEISVSFTLHDSSDHRIGLLVGALSTGEALGSIDLGNGSEGLTAAIIAPRGRDRVPSVIDPEPVFIMHPGLKKGETLPAHSGDMLGDGLGAGAFMRVVPVRGTPFSVVVRVALDGLPATGR